MTDSTSNALSEHTAEGAGAVVSLVDVVAGRAADGGAVLLVLAAFSVVALAIVLVKLYQFARLRIWSRGWQDEILAALGEGPASARAALQHARAHPSPVARVLEAALSGRVEGSVDAEALREEVERVGRAELAQLESGLRGLESIGTLAPLLGLLGTVLGMIRAFMELERAGARVDPSMLSGGIWEALLTTAVGLAVAIPAMAALAWLDGQVEGVRAQLGDVATRVLTAFPRRGPATPDAEPATQAIVSEPQHAL